MSRLRPSGVLPLLIAGGLMCNGWRLRRRLSALRTLAPADAPAGGWVRFVTAEGVTLADAVQRSAAAHARTRGLAVLDLVPADLPVEAALDLARVVDPATYRTERLCVGRGAAHALAVQPTVLERAGIDTIAGLDPVEITKFTAEAKRCAPSDTDLVVAPPFEAVDVDLGKRRAALEATGFPGVWALTPMVVRYVLLAAGFCAHRGWGVAAVLAYCAQPYLVVAGGPLRPRDLRWAWLRPVREPYTWIRTALGTWRSPEQEREREVEAAARQRYSRDLASGTARFFESRRETCPWCGGHALRKSVESPDFSQRKPGIFRLDRCLDCGHVFQNPRLSVAGLEFYYRDFYDGAGAENADFGFTVTAPVYRDRAVMVAPFTTPTRWLDVGTGQAHFCNAAREVWPDTVFDGLDMSANVERAQQRGWISRGFRGSFPELAEELAGRYDVVSMHHYLEHTRDPFTELDAAARVLLPGGYLLIEVPDPEWPLARLLGRYWPGWSQPQHQHLFPLGNLRTALADRGLTAVAEQRAQAQMPLDFGGCALFRVTTLMPDLSPWSPLAATRLRRLWRVGAWTLGAPVILAGGLVDQVIKAALRDRGRSNCYRLLARKD
ncbi:class I SAM-dependent methyltransferase [Rhodococcus daqingensis]|uniref:Class I SAM-dependent methyltransferase n=1 Tax=Rhodococcus daqingensis TaxID=2479363 RepID=A0ABW2S564_9NOCA